MESFFVKKLPRFQAFFPWKFGVPRDIWLNSTWFWPRFDQFRPISNHFAGRTWPIFTHFDLFCQAELTYFHLFGPISFHNKAPWPGRLTLNSQKKPLTKNHRNAHVISVTSYIWTRLRALNSVISAVTEFRWESSLSSSRPFVPVPKRAQRVSRRIHRV